MTDNTTVKDADNVTVTIATDDVGGVEYQVVKIAVGPDGAATLVTDLATSAAQTTGNTSLASIDADIGAPADAEATGNGSVIAILKRLRTLLSGTLTTAPNVTRGTGVVDANTQRVTIASDGALMTAVGDPVGAAAAADGSGTNTVLSALRRALLNWAALLARLPAALGQGTMAASLPVTIASNQTAVPVTLSANPTLAASTARVGFVASHGATFSDISSAVNANVTFDGVVRDAFGSGAGFDVPATHMGEVRAAYVSDVSATLEIRGATLSGGPFYTVVSQPTQVVGGGHVALVSYRPVYRYWRVRVINGATNATYSLCNSVQLAVP